MADDDASLIFIPPGGGATRTWAVSPSRFRWLRRGLGLLALVGLGLVISWGWLLARSLRVGPLETRVAELESEAARTAELAHTLEEIETRYAKLRSLFGPGVEGVESDIWLPPPRGSGRTSPVDDPMPTSWPLAQRGFVTQPLHEGAPATHPGLDIAVPTDSYIRAAGAGTVLEAGEDSVYGRYIVLDHGNGYQTRYAHAHVLLVAEGAEVRRNEVIALSGSTGRSTAPHLHFEILLDGAAVDPLTLVRQPA